MLEALVSESSPGFSFWRLARTPSVSKCEPGSVELQGIGKGPKGRPVQIRKNPTDSPQSHVGGSSTKPVLFM